MTFQSLYRKHRPQRFSEVVGQDHVTGALLNAVREDRVGHAYLFSGPRGTGKTTSARLLAKALNCTNPRPDAEPCDECDSCAEIARARESATVIERDAASAGGVDDMRDLLRGVDLSVPGKRKVYILDEVHMLTKGASNALLKTLEEPLPHVVFVLATTSPEDVLPTIRSRTQHFQFRLLPSDILTEHLADIVKREGVEADEETLRAIARRASGSARDALSLLDQALALGQGKLDTDTVQQLFEATPFDRRTAIVTAIDSEDAASALGAVASLTEDGADPRQIADDLLRHLRDVFLVAASQGKARINDVTEEERASLEEQGRSLGYQRVVRAIETLGEAAVDMRRAPDPRLILEVALVRLARREGGTRTEVLLDRVERLERSLDELRAGGTVTPTRAPDPPRTREVRPIQAPAAPAPPAAVEGAPSDDSPAPERSAPSAASRPALGAVRGAKRAPEAPEAPDASDAKPTKKKTVAKAATAESPSAPPDAPDGLELDDVVVAWPRALDSIRGMLKAVATEAQPIAIDAGTVVLGLPRRLDTQRKRLEDALGQVSELLGSALNRTPPRLRVELHDGFLEGSEPLVSEPREDAPDEAELPDEIADEEDGHLAPPIEQPLDSVDRLVDAFDATVEHESEGK